MKHQRDSQDNSPTKEEFRKNIKVITNEYGEDTIGLPHNYGTAKVITDLLKTDNERREAKLILIGDTFTKVLWRGY